MRGTHRHHGILRRLSVLIAIAVVLSVAPRVTHAATPTYYVSVYASTPYGQSPDFWTRVSPALPDGASLDGRVTCPEVYVSGDGGPTESAYGLDAGTYYFVTNSCSSTLTLTGAEGNLQILGDVYTVTPDRMAMGGVALETGPASAPTSVTLTVGLTDLPLDFSPLSDQTITFEIQLSNGAWLPNVCSAVTAFNADYTAAPASCTLSSQDATTLAQSTGAWIATFAGTRDYQGASFSGQVPGQTSSTQAATNFNNDFKGTQIVASAPPPGCEPAAQKAGEQGGFGLTGIVLYGLNCSQLQIVGTVIGAVLGAVTIVTGVGGPILDAVVEAQTEVLAEELRAAELARLAEGSFQGM